MGLTQCSGGGVCKERWQLRRGLGRGFLEVDQDVI